MTEKKRTIKTDEITETDIASDIMGNNRLQGDDQKKVRNQRHAVPNVRQSTDGIIEGLEKQDKDVRAERDLNKGARSKDKSSS